MKNPNRVRAGKHSKSKGNNNERALAKLFQDWWGHGTFARTPASGGWATAATREAFATCGDVITTAPDWPFCLELKKQEGWFLDQLMHNEKCILWKWWKQTVDETPPGLTPLLVFARNNVPQSVMFSPGWMGNLLKKFQDPQKQAPCWPWEEWPHFVFDLGVLHALDPETSWVIMSLEDFFKISPDWFGRQLPQESALSSTSVCANAG